MKIIILILSLLPVVCFSQLNKKIHSDSTGVYYVLSDTVKIENGKQEKVSVFFKGMIAENIWNNCVARYENKEKELFHWIASMLSIKAKHSLKNSLSFEPLANQFFMYFGNENVFMCSYEMMGRNGYGNLVETTQLVKYDVEPDLKK